jgi:hypothetical protein
MIGVIGHTAEQMGVMELGGLTRYEMLCTISKRYLNVIYHMREISVTS